MKNQFATVGITTIIVACISVLLTLFFTRPGEKPDLKPVSLTTAAKYTTTYQKNNPTAIKAMRISAENIDSLDFAEFLRGAGRSMRLYFGAKNVSIGYDVLVLVPTDDKGNDAPFIADHEKSVFVIQTDPKKTDLCPRICDSDKSPLNYQPSSEESKDSDDSKSSDNTESEPQPSDK